LPLIGAQRQIPVPLDYILKRVLQLILIIWIAVTINFIIPRLIPGDPIESALQTKIAMSGNVSVDVQAVAALYRSKFGLDKPLWQQYLNYWRDILSLNLGVSLVDFPDPVISKIASAVPWTLGLLTVATAISFALGSLLGALVAWPRAPGVLRVVVPPLMLLSSVPFFLLGIILIFLFSVMLNVFPPGGGSDPISILRFDAATALDILYHAALPAIALVLGSVGFWALGMRAMMISVQSDDFVQFADAKGLKDSTIFTRYAGRNALLPQVTALGLTIGHILSGALLVEIVFGYPGIGTVLYKSIRAYDFFAIQGIVFGVIVSITLATLILDLIYPRVDPRISYVKG